MPSDVASSSALPWSATSPVSITASTSNCAATESMSGYADGLRCRSLTCSDADRAGRGRVGRQRAGGVVQRDDVGHQRAELLGVVVEPLHHVAGVADHAGGVRQRAGELGLGERLGLEGGRRRPRAVPARNTARAGRRPRRPAAAAQAEQGGERGADQGERDVAGDQDDDGAAQVGADVLAEQAQVGAAGRQAGDGLGVDRLQAHLEGDRRVVGAEPDLAERRDLEHAHAGARPGAATAGRRTGRPSGWCRRARRRRGLDAEGGQHDDHEGGARVAARPAPPAGGRPAAPGRPLAAR